MITDSIYRIGHNHEVCQDYAIAGNRRDLGGIPYAIISDGCSSSPDVDFGARFMALAARDSIRHIQDRPDVEWYRNIGRDIKWRARSLTKNLDLDERAIDATVLWIEWRENVVATAVKGDGFTFYIDKDLPDTLHLEEYEYTENTPYYLSVEYDQDIKKLFDQLNQTYIIRRWTIHKDGTYGLMTERYPGNHRPVSISSRPEDFLMVGVASDGWSTFYRKDNKETIPVPEIFKRFIEFPVATEGLLKRQVNHHLKDLAKNGIIHYDDLSMAIIYNNQERS